MSILSWQTGLDGDPEHLSADLTRVALIRVPLSAYAGPAMPMRSIQVGYETARRRFVCVVRERKIVSSSISILAYSE